MVNLHLLRVGPLSKVLFFNDVVLSGPLVPLGSSLVLPRSHWGSQNIYILTFLWCFFKLPLLHPTSEGSFFPPDSPRLDTLVRTRTRLDFSRRWQPKLIAAINNWVVGWGDEASAEFTPNSIKAVWVGASWALIRSQRAPGPAPTRRTGLTPLMWSGSSVGRIFSIRPEWFSAHGLQHRPGPISCLVPLGVGPKFKKGENVSKWFFFPPR